MSKQEILVEALDAGCQFLWTASGSSIVGKHACLWCAYTGQQETVVQDWGWIEALHPDDRKWVRQLWSQAAEHKRFYETRYRIRNVGGIYHTFLIRCMPVLNEDGTLREWIGQLSLVTAERTLFKPDNSQTNLLYHMFIEQASIGMVYLSIDGRYLDVNAQFCSMLGYTREELIGRCMEEVTHPDDIETNWAHLKLHLADSLPSSTFEKRCLHKDGKIIWVKITGLLLRVPSADPLCFFGLVEDITVQKRIEEEQERLLEFERAAGDAARREKYEASALVDQLKAVFEAMTDGVTFRDVEGKLLLINAAGRRLLELGSEIDLTEESYQDLHSLYEVSDEHRQLLPVDQWPVGRIVRGEVFSSEHAMDTIVRLPSGREVQYGYSGAPVYDRQGHQIGGVCVFRDITEARQKEHRVQQTLNALLTVVEAVSRYPIEADEPIEAVSVQPFYLSTVGRNLTETIRQVLQCHFVACFLNELQPDSGRVKTYLAGVSGFTVEEERRYRKEVKHFFDTDFLEPESLARLRANEVLTRDLVTQPYVKLRSDFGIRYRILAPMLLDGQLAGVLVIGKAGADVVHTQEEVALVKAIAKLVLQIFERTRLTREWTAARTDELALREANRRFDAFLSIASHELRTPLTTIKGNVQLALRRMEPLKSLCSQPLAADSYEQIVQALERVHFPLTQAFHRTRVQERMIGDLLDASRIRANKLELRMHPCNLEQIMHQMVEDLHYFASDRLVHLHLPENCPVLIVADADRIGQVVSNYLINALRYSPHDRPVEVSLELIEEGKVARVAVRDQGVGIAHQDLRHIWERFYRSHATERQYNAGAGLGLGLYISRTIIERHGGHVGVESVQGKGSTFWFTLPLAAPGEMC
ncbi:MAG TPA: PAS domain S-box protein [Ktedonobacteraceae bacterium]|nr:PAS domain S-box protein [Ktedonobacteraceae bacterium]